MGGAAQDRVKVSEPGTEAPTAGPAAGARTREEAVLALQRSAGNAAVGRLAAGSRRALARKPSKAAAPQLDANTVLIRPATPPNLKAHGEYDWGVWYALPLPAAVDGWMIQDLHQETSDGAHLHFWETWKVLAGKVEPERIAADRFDDHYHLFSVPGAAHHLSGWVRHTGIIRFYPGPLPPEFGREIIGTYHYNSDTMPTGWTGQGMRHDAYAEWGPTYNGFVGYMGITEVREGANVTFRPR